MSVLRFVWTLPPPLLVMSLWVIGIIMACVIYRSLFLPIRENKHRLSTLQSDQFPFVLNLSVYTEQWDGNGVQLSQFSKKIVQYMAFVIYVTTGRV
jgi:hypothetical protein